MSYDVRTIANIVIELAEDKGRNVSNLSLNKIVYFLHEAYLIETGSALVNAKIEAWDHGPVFRELYHFFKKFGAGPISGKATTIDPISGERRILQAEVNAIDQEFIHSHANRLLQVDPGSLVGMSHAEGGPWYTARFGGNGLNPGVAITDSLILRCLATEVRQ